MKVAITGASGHIGVNLCMALVEQNYFVKALFRNDRTGLTSLPIEFVQGDVLDKKSLNELVDGADIVFHLAAKISIEGDPDGSVYNINVLGTKNLVEACLNAGVKRLIHFSSIHAFDLENAGDILNEDSPKAKENSFAYDHSKKAGEIEVLKGFAQGLETIILNPTSVLGPYDYKPSLMGQAILDMYHGKLPGLIQGGFDWVDVRDIVDASLNAMTQGRPGEQYLLSGRWEPVSEIAHIVSTVSAKKPPRITFPLWVAYIALPFLKLWAKITNQTPLFTKESLAALTHSHKNIYSEKAMEELEFKVRPLEETITESIGWMKLAGKIK